MTESAKFTSAPYWHLHHDKLLEWTTEPIEHRIDYIKAVKPKHEVETRLRLLRPVHGELPKSVAEVDYDYAGACRIHRAGVEALHAIECPDCPWDGKTIFPASEEG